MHSQRSPGTACSIFREPQTGTHNAGNARARMSTCKHLKTCAWPDLCAVFHMWLVKLHNSLAQDPGSALVGGGDTWDRNLEKPLS